MSHKENPLTVKARNARTGRKEIRSAQGNEWKKAHPEESKRMDKKSYERRKLGQYAEMLQESFTPISFESDNVAVTGDWHIPFCNDNLVDKLMRAPKEHGTTDLIIAGDMWDCDIYSRFTHLSPPAVFDEECEAVKSYLKRILRVYKNVYIARGNHEKRFIDLNAGKIGMKELFALARPSNISEDNFNKKVHITLDDHINITQRGKMWLCCHPRNYRQVHLSVARDLSAKYQCNVITAHGHSWAQGLDRSGKNHILEGGGLFDREALAYLRDTACNPMTHSGYYILKEGNIIVVDGEL